MESLKAITIGGIITIIGWISREGETRPSFPHILSSVIIIRGIIVGSQKQLEAMVYTIFSFWWFLPPFQLGSSYLCSQIRVIEASNIKPVLNQHVVKLEHLKEEVNSTLKQFLLQANVSRAYKYFGRPEAFWRGCSSD